MNPKKNPKFSFPLLFYPSHSQSNSMENLKQQQPLIVYQRKRKRKKSLEAVKSHTIASSNNNAPENQPMNNNNNNRKTIFVYKRRRRRITTDTHVFNLEADGLCVNSSDSPIDFTSITEIHSTKSNHINGGLESSGCRTDKKRAYDLRSATAFGPVQHPIRSGVSRPVQSQLSTTAEEAKPDVSATSDITQAVPNSGKHIFQRAKSAPGRHKRYLKYSTILKNTSNGIVDAKITQHGKDFDICKEAEDYVGDQRKKKIIKTIESLYALPIANEDFCMKPWYFKCTAVKDMSYVKDISKITQHGEDSDIYIEDEDYMGDERKRKVTRSIKSLYASSIVIYDFHTKP